MTGDTLRKERERQKLTIQDIEQGTSIRAVYIEALETGNYDKLPGEVYAKGFVKNYANFLNLDADKLSKEFVAELSPTTVAETEIFDAQEEKIISENPKAEKLKITELTEPNVKIEKTSEGSGNFSIIAAVILIAMLAGGAWYFLNNSSGNIADVNQNPPQQTEVVQPTENSANNSVAAASNVEGVNIQATFSGDCWTRVYVDGVYTYEGVPTSGQVMNWNGAEGITIRVGNAGAININFNGQSVGTLGAVGEVTEKTFTKNGTF